MTSETALPKTSSPIQSNRLFIGGISENTSTDCLVTLLRPFGEATDVELNSRGFAHVTFDETSTIEKCITTLNRTTWRNKTLTLQRAHEHYLTRLRREWKQPNAIPTNDTQQQHDDDSDKQAKQPKPEKPIKFLWKGKRIRFNFDDSDVNEIDLNFDSNEEEEEKEDKHKVRPNQDIINQQESHENSQTQHNLIKSIPTNQNITSKTKPLSSSIVSTLSLFGVQPELNRQQSPLKRKRSTPSVPPPSDEPDVAKKTPEKKQRIDNIIKTKDANRAHTTNVELNMKTVTEMERNVKLVDLSRERKAALGVLGSMFPAEGKPIDVDTNKFKRPALYRRLLSDDNQSSSNASKSKQRITVIVDSSIGSSPDSTSAIRRKGLFRKLKQAEERT